MSFREKLNQLGFSWELPTHTKRKRKGDEDAVERGEDATVPVAKTEEERITEQDFLSEILPVANSGGGSSKWPHEVRTIALCQSMFRFYLPTRLYHTKDARMIFFYCTFFALRKLMRRVLFSLALS